MSQSLPTSLDYNNGVGVLTPDQFRISASGISRFFTSTSSWFRENLLGESGFISNSASVTGTIVHYICEQFVANGVVTDADKNEISKYILKHTNSVYSDYNPDISIDYINTNYKPMAEAIINDYLIHNPATHVEPFIAHEVLPNIFVGGSIDNLTLASPKYSSDAHSFENLVSSASGTIVDYKTTNTKPASLPANIQYSHKLQLLTYAWVLRQKGITIDRIRIVYCTSHEVDRYSDKTGKKLQDYPSTVKVLTEQLTEEDFNTIDGIIRLIADTIQVWQTHPELRYILAQDYRLK